MNTMFPQGNIDSWNQTITQYMPQAMNVIVSQIIPSVDAAMLELLGRSDSFEKVQGSMDVKYFADGTPRAIVCKIQYFSPSLQVFGVSPEDIYSDESFINQYLMKIPNIKFTPAHMDVNTGLVTIVAEVGVGYQGGKLDKTRDSQ